MPTLIIAVVSLIVVVLAGAVPVAAQSYKAEFKNSLITGPIGPWGEAATKFADLVRERTQGRINVKNYFSGQLFAGKQTNEFVLLNQGVACRSCFPPTARSTPWRRASPARRSSS